MLLINFISSIFLAICISFHSSLGDIFPRGAQWEVGGGMGDNCPYLDFITKAK